MENVILSEPEQIKLVLEYTKLDRVHTLTELSLNITKSQARHLLRILKEPCTEHPYPNIFITECGDSIMYETSKTEFNYYKHRKDCTECLAEIEKEIEG